jgi:hypothetical protein
MKAFPFCSPFNIISFIDHQFYFQSAKLMFDFMWVCLVENKIHVLCVKMLLLLCQQLFCFVCEFAVESHEKRTCEKAFWGREKCQKCAIWRLRHKVQILWIINDIFLVTRKLSEVSSENINWEEKYTNIAWLSLMCEL